MPQALKDRVVELAEREYRKESEVVRDALAAYIDIRAVNRRDDLEVPLVRRTRNAQRFIDKNESDSVG